MNGGEVGLIIGVFLISVNALSQKHQIYSTSGAVWPQPRFIVQDDSFFLLQPQHFHFLSVNHSCDVLQKALIRYISVIENDSMGNLNKVYSRGIVNTSLPSDPDPYFEGILTHLTVKLNQPCENFPHLNMNETYELNIGLSQPHDFILQSDSIWGILRGLETFVQITYKDNKTNQLIVKRSHIIDSPRFKHRGLLLDTSRHYLQKEIIFKMLDAMEINKMNVLHWHIVDDQSFPYESITFPTLSEKGAYHPQAYIYSHHNIKEIIQYARLRGIRILPEFDTPGHTLSWGEGMKGLLTKCYRGVQPSGDFGPIDPSNRANYKFMEKLLEEIETLFPERCLHIGGDEVDYTCWKSNPGINKFMQKMEISGDYAKLEEFYVQKIIDIAQKLESVPLVWQEVFEHGVNISKETIVQIWTGNQETLLKDVTSSGHFAILSTCWYLDHFAMDLYGGGGDWRKFYDCEPLSFNGTQAEKSLVLGGEACMWGEFVDDTNIIQRVWPRASAAAEKLWSPEYVRDPEEAAHRLEEHVCRMRRRGIQAQPPNGPGACL